MNEPEDKEPIYSGYTIYCICCRHKNGFWKLYGFETPSEEENFAALKSLDPDCVFIAGFIPANFLAELEGPPVFTVNPN